MAVAIDPEILAVRAAMAAATGPFDIMTLPPAEGRALIDKAAMILNDGLPDMATVEDHDVGGMRVRVYTPRTCAAGTWLYYIHGGGWFACSVDTHDRMLRMLADLTGAKVFSPDYRHAPEHPFPIPLDDCRRGLLWAMDQRPGTKFALAGDSAGANMALSLGSMTRDAGRPPAGLALLYGCYAPGLDTESAREFGAGGYGLTDERMQWYWRNYLAGTDAVGAMPLHGNRLGGLPPVFLGIAEADSVADDSRLLAEKLDSVELKVWPGATHGFLQMSRDVALARAAISDIAAAIRGWLA